METNEAPAEVPTEPEFNAQEAIASLEARVGQGFQMFTQQIGQEVGAIKSMVASPENQILLAVNEIVGSLKAERASRIKAETELATCKAELAKAVASN